MDLVDDVDELADDRRCQAEGQLVDEEDLGIWDQGLADRQHLLLAAGEVPRQLVDAIGQAGEEGQHPLLGVAHGRVVLALEPAGQTQVVADGEGGEHAPAARHHHDATRRDLVGGKASELLASEHDRSRRRRQQPRDALEQRRLSGAVGSEEGDDLALVDLQVEPEEDLHGSVRSVEALHGQEGRLGHDRAPAMTLVSSSGSSSCSSSSTRLSATRLGTRRWRLAATRRR